jgi:hypothetical protein
LIRLSPWSIEQGANAAAPVHWAQDQQASVALDDVIASLERAGAHRLREGFEPVLLQHNVSASVDLGFRNQRGELNPPLKGATIELFNDDIVFTDAGVESLSSGLLATASKFPETIKIFVAPRPPPYVRPDPPDGFPTDEWTVLMECAESTYLGRTAWAAPRKGLAATMPLGLPPKGPT